jgi:hypothetical protein
MARTIMTEQKDSHCEIALRCLTCLREAPKDLFDPIPKTSSSMTGEGFPLVR